MERRGWSMHRTCVSAAAVLLAFAAATGPRPAHGAAFPDLYTLTVSPDPSAGDPRTSAIQTAMRRLLERVTGDRGAALDPDLKDMVDDAGRYVRSYATLGGDQDQVGFIASEVNRALESRGRPVWPPERPLTLLWIAVDGGHGERTLLAADGSGTQASPTPEMAALTDDIRKQLNDVRDERGLPIVLPLLDLQDLDHIGFADVWGGFDQRIEQASARYGADAVLVGRVLATDVGTDVQWTLLRGAEQEVTSGESVAEGLEWLADHYAQQYSVVGGVRSLELVVQDVESLADYGRVMSYLGGLSSLQSVDVESLANRVLTLRVAARGDTDVLARSFTLGRVLQPVGGAPTQGTNGGGVQGASDSTADGDSGEGGGAEQHGAGAGGVGAGNTMVVRVLRSGSSPQ